MAKINISIDDELLKRADDYADNNYMSRSGLITSSLTEYLNARELVSAVRKMNMTLDKIADKGQVDDETLEDLEDLEKLVELLSGIK